MMNAVTSSAFNHWWAKLHASKKIVDKPKTDEASLAAFNWHTSKKRNLIELSPGKSEHQVARKENAKQQWRCKWTDFKIQVMILR